jgi:hypothetical protein
MEKFFKIKNGEKTPNMVAIATHLMQFLEKHKAAFDGVAHIQFRVDTDKTEGISIILFNKGATKNTSLYVFDLYDDNLVDFAIETAEAFISGKISFRELCAKTR